MTKAEAERVHARRRALERYGVQVGDATRIEIVRLIRGGRSRVVERRSNRVAVHDVVLADGLAMRVVYDRSRGELVTFLPVTGGGGPLGVT